MMVMRVNAKDQLAGFGWIIRSAGIYFLLIGMAWTFMPHQVFGFFHAEPPGSPLLWNWIGLIIASYGIGLLLGSSRPSANWVILLMGFLAMLSTVLLTLGPTLSGAVAPGLGWVVIISNIVWLTPFAIMLSILASEPVGEHSRAPVSSNINFEAYKDQYGISLAAFSQQQPVLIVLLRQLGCPFARETLAELAQLRRQLEDAGVKLALIHTASDEEAASVFSKYHLQDVFRVTDPDASLYRAMGLGKASVAQMYGPGMWSRIFQASVSEGHGFGKIMGDRFQMPGAFLVSQGAVIGGYRHKRISDQPDYESLIQCATPAEDIHF